ncbi:MAG: mitochondrial fission ELM1 family protein [Methylocystis sp.]
MSQTAKPFADGRGKALATLPKLNLRILSDGRAGHEAQMFGVAEALGLTPDIRDIHPRPFFAAIAPFGPLDPREAETRPGSPIAPPWPDIALACGRRTLPYLRRLKHASKNHVFTVYLNAPANGSRAADFVVAPVHDGMFGPTVFTPVTPANRISATLLAESRENPDPRVAALPAPRAALMIGGDNRHFRLTPADALALADVVRTLFSHGFSVMATASRRTPPFVAEALAPALKEGAGWLWDGAGDNPYPSMLALADAIVVTADSVNMVGEAVATGAPVHVFAATGKSRRIADYLERLQRLGAVRPWSDAVERWTYEPINSTPSIAQAITRAYAIFRGLPEFL